jgi:hypothetical protein
VTVTSSTSEPATVKPSPWSPIQCYGHNLADLIALSSIALLGSVESLAKFEAATALLRHNPEAVDLRIEDDGPRKGMWSVTQPQWVAVFHRTR